MIVGLTGPNAAGKGEAARFLREHGFVYHSLSDVVREEATARGLDHARESLIRVGNDLRARVGPGVLAERIAAKLVGEGPAEGQNALIDSIRSPAEVAVLRSLPGFILVGIDAPAEMRFDRARLRGRAGDGTTLEEFTRKEALENTNDPAAQQLTRAFALADTVVMNDGTVEELRERLARALLGTDSV